MNLIVYLHMGVLVAFLAWMVWTFASEKKNEKSRGKET